MQNRTLIYGLVAIAILASTGAAFAQLETDRLREALRQAIAQTRTLEDERTALQGKLASAECDKANLKAQVEGAQAETKKAQKQDRDAVEDFQPPPSPTRRSANGNRPGGSGCRKCVVDRASATSTSRR